MPRLNSSPWRCARRASRSVGVSPAMSKVVPKTCASPWCRVVIVNNIHRRLSRSNLHSGKYDLHLTPSLHILFVISTLLEIHPTPPKIGFLGSSRPPDPPVLGAERHQWKGRPKASPPLMPFCARSRVVWAGAPPGTPISGGVGGYPFHGLPP